MSLLSTQGEVPMGNSTISWDGDVLFDMLRTREVLRVPPSGTRSKQATRERERVLNSNNSNNNDNEVMKVTVTAYLPLANVLMRRAKEALHAQHHEMRSVCPSTARK